jgi:GTP-binding protein
MNPPVVVMHGNSLEHVTDAYKRFWKGAFARHLSWSGRRCALR